MHPALDWPFGVKPPSERCAGHELHNLQVRVSSEFREMPGLRLTVAQASRLFSIDTVCCERVLGALVERGVLATNGHAFARADVRARCV